MKVYHYDSFTFPLPENHRFPVQKYTGLREYILQEKIIASNDMLIPAAASQEQLSLVHTQEYLEKVFEGKMSDKEIRRLGFPWSPELVERARRSVGSTIAICHTALTEGVSASLGGGTHHAYPDHAEGFCLFNDIAIAARNIQLEGRADRIAILDCDVHQGNGTAAIFQGDDSVFTFSIHGAKNYPFHKETSDFDIALPDGTEDEAYLSALTEGLEKVFLIHEQDHFDMAIYLAGADPYIFDRLGRMALSMNGLAQRDEMILTHCSQAGLPVAITMGGGYAVNIADIVSIHAQTIQIANRFWHEKLTGKRIVQKEIK